MGNTITRDKFIAELSNSQMDNHGVIDVNDMSPELKKVLKENGISEEELRKVAGADGQIKNFKSDPKQPERSEFGKLFKVVDKFDQAKPDSFELRDLSKPEKPFTPSGAVYEALRQEVIENMIKEQYTQPGLKKVEAQPNMSIDKARKVNYENQTPLSLNVKGLNQVDPNDPPEKQHKACFETAIKQADECIKSTHGKDAFKLNDYDQAIQVAYAEDEKGRVKTNKKQMDIALNYIDTCLNNAYPVVVGVSVSANRKINHDKMTEHFVTIYGRNYDENGKLFYEFKDPGAGGATGRFYIDDATGKLFKPGIYTDKRAYVRDLAYEVTQVRTYKDME